MKLNANFKSGVFHGLGFLSVLLAGAAGYLFAQTFSTFQSGELVSATKLNENFQVAAPSGAILAFNLSACPSGWIAADGTNGTPDLRGVFVRGLNDFGTGTRADGNQDPAGARALLSFQNDAFQGHRHQTLSHWYNQVGAGAQGGAGINLDDSSHNTIDPVSDGTNGTPRTATETRVKNVGLIYCQRQ